MQQINFYKKKKKPLFAKEFHSILENSQHFTSFFFKQIANIF